MPTHQRIRLKRYPTIRIPTPTTPANVAIRRTLRTFRRMIISGRESPITDIMNARTVPSAAPFAQEGLHDRDDARRVGVHGDPDHDGQRNGPPRSRSHDRRP